MAPKTQSKTPKTPKAKATAPKAKTPKAKATAPKAKATAPKTVKTVRVKKKLTLADYRRKHRRIPGDVVREYEGEFAVKTDKKGNKTFSNTKIGDDGKQAVRRRNNAPLGRPPTDETIRSVYSTAKETRIGRK